MGSGSERRKKKIASFAKRLFSLLMVTHHNLAEWYLALERYLAAGVALPKALRDSGGVPAAWREEAAARLEAGEPFDDLLTSAPKWLPRTDRFVLSAAASSGRLVEMLPLLREMHDNAAKRSREVMGACLYPLFILHFAVFLLPLPSVVAEEGPGYLVQVLPALGVMWGVIGVIWWGWQKRLASFRWLAGKLPGVAGALSYQAWARFTGVMRGLYLAGAPMEEVWFGAGESSGDRDLAALALRMVQRIQKGERPGDSLSGEKALPANFVSFYRNGEETGQLDQCLAKLEVEFREEATRRLFQVSFWYPKLIYLLVAVYIGWQIIQFFQGYLEIFDDILGP